MRRQHGSIATIITDRLGKNDADRRIFYVCMSGQARHDPSMISVVRSTINDNHAMASHTQGGSKVVEVALLKIEWGVSGA